MKGNERGTGYAGKDNSYNGYDPACGNSDQRLYAAVSFFHIWNGIPHCAGRIFRRRVRHHYPNHADTE